MTEALLSSLQRLRFLSSGTVLANETYALVRVPSIYNEEYTYMGRATTDGGRSPWLPRDPSWVTTTGLPYLFRLSNDSVWVHEDATLSGTPLHNASIVDSWAKCRWLCDQRRDCVAWAFANGSCTPFAAVSGGRTPRDGGVCGCARWSLDPGCFTAPFASHASSPPVGLRSAVAIGPLGEGSLEMRADGRFGDFGTIFNNGPYAVNDSWAVKIELDDVAFGVRAGSHAALLRTHAPLAAPELPTLPRLTWQGGFPASRLSGTLVTERIGMSSAQAQAASVEIGLTAFGHFQPDAAQEGEGKGEEASEADAVAPVVYFSLQLRHSEPAALPVAAFLNLGGAAQLGGGTFTLDVGAPNSAVETTSAGAASSGGGATSLTLNLPGNRLPMGRQARGNLSVSLLHAESTHAPSLCAISGATLNATWSDFAAATPGYCRGISGSLPPDTEHAALQVALTLAPHETATLTFALTWYFPHRMWGTTDLGHRYQRHFRSSVDVARKQKQRAAVALQAALKWQSLALNSTLPIWLQDALLHTPASWGKTAMYLSDGRWRTHAPRSPAAPQLRSLSSLTGLTAHISFTSCVLSCLPSSAQASLRATHVRKWNLHTSIWHDRSGEREWPSPSSHPPTSRRPLHPPLQPSPLPPPLPPPATSHLPTPTTPSPPPLTSLSLSTLSTRLQIPALPACSRAADAGDVRGDHPPRKLSPRRRRSVQ